MIDILSVILLDILVGIMLCWVITLVRSTPNAPNRALYITVIVLIIIIIVTVTLFNTYTLFVR